ncbi:MAG: histidine kinase [Flavobacteriaceae bacterium]|nr:histidine kinase [Flavobacteriaceae bacterium]
MKNKLIAILLNQYFIAFVIAVFIFFNLPEYFSKYHITLKEKGGFIKENKRIYFADLNNDNKSEKITCFDNVNKLACFNIYKPNGDLIEQWNYQTHFPKSNKTLWFLDVNKNGFNEIYFITQKKDSAFLNVIEPLAKNGIDNRKIFIDTIVPFHGDYKFNIGLGSRLLHSKDKNEVLFTLQTGFKGYPRKAYKYNLATNKIYQSPHLTNVSSISQVLDLDNDSKEEIILQNNSSGNSIDTVFTKRSDYSTWLMVLKNDLSFLFEPVAEKVPFSGLHSFFFKDKAGYKIISLLNSSKTDITPTKLMVFSLKGEKLKEKLILEFKHVNWFFLDAIKNRVIVYNGLSGEAKEFDYNLKEVKASILRPNTFLYPLDVDNDRKNEWLSVAFKEDNITIYRHNFTHPVTIQIPKDIKGILHYGLKKLSKNKNQLYFQKGDYYFIYDYTKNEMYYFKYLVFLGIYLSVLALVLLIIKGQKYREAKKLAIENEISKLQIKTIKNQVDSHFVFNAINTISEMKLMDNKIEADNFICHFSDFMRRTLWQSDKISIGLQEEIDYVINYLDLQKIRFNNSFDYHINIDKSIDTQTPIPKHVLFTYVENALKHGLYNKTNGLLKIEIKNKDKNLFLSVEDNGGGIIKSAKLKKNSTGNGLLIMENIYKLYFKLYKRKISHKIIEVLDSKKAVQGLKIEVLISN